MMKTFFITFAQSHPLKDHYVGVLAPDMEQATAGAFRTFGENFAFVYAALDEARGLYQQILNYGISSVFHFRTIYKEAPYTEFIDESIFKQAMNLQLAHMQTTNTILTSKEELL